MEAWSGVPADGRGPIAEPAADDCFDALSRFGLHHPTILGPAGRSTRNSNLLIESGESRYVLREWLRNAERADLAQTLEHTAARLERAASVLRRMAGQSEVPATERVEWAQHEIASLLPPQLDEADDHLGGGALVWANAREDIEEADILLEAEQAPDSRPRATMAARLRSSDHES